MPHNRVKRVKPLFRSRRLGVKSLGSRLVLVLTLLARRLRDRSWTGVASLGLAGGVAIFVCYALAYALTDGWK